MFKVFYVVEGGKPEPGPEFATLEEAQRHARGAGRKCDILLPDGRWYARQSTVGVGESSDAPSDSIGWMRGGPSRTTAARRRIGSDPGGDEP